MSITGSLLDDGDALSPGIIASSTIGSLTINANAQAPIQATGITGIANVEGNLSSSISLSSSLPSNGRITIGGSLLATGSIAVPTNGLAGRVIVNDNHSTGSWIGPITVGTTNLSPNYSDTAASLGGGTVGLVPFDLHGTDSLPVDGASVLYESRPTATSPIRIRLYGPMTFTSGQMPVSITAESEYSGGEIEQTDGVTGCIANVLRDGTNSTILVITPPRSHGL